MIHSDYADLKDHAHHAHNADRTKRHSLHLPTAPAGCAHSDAGGCGGKDGGPSFCAATFRVTVDISTAHDRRAAHRYRIGPSRPERGADIGGDGKGVLTNANHSCHDIARLGSRVMGKMRDYTFAVLCAVGVHWWSVVRWMARERASRTTWLLPACSYCMHTTHAHPTQ